MAPVHCEACGTDARPKLRHPSTLKAEVTVWTLALAIGLTSGAWSALTSTPGPLGEVGLSALVVPARSAVDGPAEVEAEDSGSRSTSTLAVAAWTRDVVLDFARTAWWALLVPVLFSLWRQSATYEACIHCQSRKLVPIEGSPDPWHRLADGR